MKANDLMIGDWVAFRGRPYQYTAQDIATMAECEEKGIATDTTPIPITPEILEKNGFERTDCGGGAIIYTFSDDDEYYALAIDEYTDSIWRVEYTNCEMPFPLVRIMVLFVHELQHALRLFGVEKEIEL